MRRFTVAVMMIVAVAVAGSGARADRRRSVKPPVSPFTLYRVDLARIGGILSDQDGTLWLFGPKVARYTQTGILSIIEEQNSGGWRVLTRDGRLCGTASTDFALTVRCLDANGVRQEYGFSGPGRVNSMAMSSDGGLWFMDDRGKRIGHVSPAGKTEEFPLPASLTRPNAIEVDAFDRVWFLNDRSIVRLLDDGGFEVIQLDPLFEGRSASGFFGVMTATPDGALWFGISAESRTSGLNKGAELVRMAPNGRVTSVASFGFVESIWIVAGNFESVWLVVRSSYFGVLYGYELLHVWPDGKRIKYGLPRLRESAFPYNVGGLAVDPFGHVWVSLNRPFADGNAALAKLTP